MSFLRSYHRAAMKRRLIAGDVPEWLRKHKRRNYVFKAILSFPYWVSRAELKKIDDEAKRLTAMTGILHTVDHQIPINHPLVSGLTVPWNLQVLTARENFSKGNRWSDEPDAEQDEMFPKTKAEQYSLSF